MKLEDVAEEIQEELEELFAFVKLCFIEIMEHLGVPAPEKKLPRFHTEIRFFLGSKQFVKSLLDIERKGKTEYGSTVERHPQDRPYSQICATTLVRKDQENKEEMLAHIFVNGPRLRVGAVKEKMEMKKYATIILIHEMLHTLEALTGVSFLKSTFVRDDGFTMAIYEEYEKKEKARALENL